MSTPPTASRTVPDRPTTTRFGGIVVRYGADVLTPRPWTLAQSRWAAALADRVPPGPVLELCCGAGAIGLEAARASGRPAVLVDASPSACRWAATNAAGAGVVADIRQARLDDALHEGERFPLILADPPYVPTSAVDRYPDDPVTAIDGGPDGLAVLRTVARLLGEHLEPGGAALVQTRGPIQARQVAQLAAAPGLRRGRIRTYGAERAIVELWATGDATAQGGKGTE